MCAIKWNFKKLWLSKKLFHQASDLKLFLFIEHVALNDNLTKEVPTVESEKEKAADLSKDTSDEDNNVNGKNEWQILCVWHCRWGGFNI